MGCGRSMPQRVEGVGGGASSKRRAVNLFFFNPSRLFVEPAQFTGPASGQPAQTCKSARNTLLRIVYYYEWRVQICSRNAVLFDMQ